jgi:hypothetical protein
MFKFPYHSFIGLMLLASASAASATTLLSKTTTPGYVMPETALYTSCTLDDQGFLIMKNQINGVTSKKNVIVQVDAADIVRLRKAIDVAAKGSIKKPEMQIADAPSTTYYAYQKTSGDKLKQVFLAEDNGMSNTSTYNMAPEALMLRNFIDALCK